VIGERLSTGGGDFFLGVLRVLDIKTAGLFISSPCVSPVLGGPRWSGRPGRREGPYQPPTWVRFVTRGRGRDSNGRLSLISVHYASVRIGAACLVLSSVSAAGGSRGNTGRWRGRKVQSPGEDFGFGTPLKIAEG